MSSFFLSDGQPHPHAHAGAGAGVQARLQPVPPGSAGMHVAVASQRRTEVRPPALFSLSRPRWQRWLARTWQWLWDLDDSPPPAPSSMGALWGIKAEFSAALWDLQSLPANRVRDEVACARSLRELWHLRAEVFKVVAMHRGQIQAQARLDVLDGHFPVRCSTRRSEAGRQGRASRW